MRSLIAPLWQQPMVMVLLLLSVFGVGMIYSAGVLEVPSSVTEGLWIRQTVFLGVSVVGLLIVSRIPLRWFEWIAVPAYVLGVGVLGVTLVAGTGTGTAEGISSFLSIAGFRFQPAEAAKISTALALAALLASREEPPRYLRDLLTPAAVVGLPLVLVLLQPDLGTALAFVGIFFAVIFWAGTPWPLILFAASPGLGLILAFSLRVWAVYIVLLAIGLYLYRFRLYMVESVAVILGNVAAGAVAQPLWNSLAEYQRNRLLVFLDPSLDPRNAGWQLVQSKVAVGSGGIFGKGFTAGTQKRLAFLPEQHTDFIFSVVGEEFGFIGTSVVLALFGYLFFRMIMMAEAARRSFAGLFIFGILGVWLTHVFINAGMTIGVVPVTGIPLPFISYGGSFLLMSWMAAAVVVALASDDS
ncbi:MAG: rod shape-determining protein RodA [Gemmatimonadetes bacterium]|nr:rod shape-determining protein RodA [Gemmatimonadota bacterium]MYB98075.1 rod shape-determining protein RodA [Gemmatimonadota bacterium]MYI45624.1 rod shape-determining protein RodA [Gemmatimonadota bacterium]